MTVSNSSRDDIAHVFDIDPETISVIHHGIDITKFAGGDENASPPVDGPYALYIGNLEPRKNLVALVRAFETPKVTSLGIRLVVAGRPAWNYSEILQEIEAASNTHYLGFVTDQLRAQLMRAAEFFVFPSLYEGFGFPVLEAMAARCPVLCSRRGSLDEVAGPAGLITDLSGTGIADSVVRFVSGELSTYDRGGAQSWAQGFTWEKSVRKHLAVYESAMR